MLRRSRRALTLAPVVACALATRAAAQAPAPAAPADTFPARAGTWALEGGVSTGEPTLGVLRFANARTAVGFNVFGNYNSGTTEFDGGGLGGVQEDEDRRSTAVGGSVGVRRYSALRGPLAGFGTLGALVSFVHQRGDRDRNRYSGAGGFGELGVAYVAARRLTVSAFTRASVLRQSGRQTFQMDAGGGRLVTSTVRSRGWSAQAGAVGLAATLFF